MTAEVIPFRDPDPLLSPEDVVRHKDVKGKIGRDLAYTICRTYGIRPSGKKQGRLFIRESVLQKYLSNQHELRKNTDAHEIKHKPNPYRRGGRSWI